MVVWWLKGHLISFIQNKLIFGIVISFVTLQLGRHGFGGHITKRINKWKTFIFWNILNTYLVGLTAVKVSSRVPLRASLSAKWIVPPPLANNQISTNCATKSKQNMYRNFSFSKKVKGKRGGKGERALEHSKPGIWLESGKW